MDISTCETKDFIVSLHNKTTYENRNLFIYKHNIYILRAYSAHIKQNGNLSKFTYYYARIYNVNLIQRSLYKFESLSFILTKLLWCIRFKTCKSVDYAY